QDFVRFGDQGEEPALGQDFRTNDEFQPKNALVGLLLHCSKLADEVRAALGPTSGPVVRGDRSAGAAELIRDIPAFGASRKGVDNFHHPKREYHGAFFELGGAHRKGSCLIQSELRSPHSAINSFASAAAASTSPAPNRSETMTTFRAPAARTS